ncbi:MAG: magnesium chelatase domain-containing protein [Oribacterium sp.]|nr:magnesium chelatase domain-containing protein [Oribacterium sp.]
MATVTASFAIEAVDAVKVEIEATTIGGPPMVSIIGLGDKAVLEAADRLEGCLIYSGFEMPREKVIINLAPGDLKKRGAHYDLGMAIALLCLRRCMRQPVDTISFSWASRAVANR